MANFPKVLISCPTAKAKDYCFKEWLENVWSFTYPNYDVVLFDNTVDEGAYTKYMNKYHRENYGYDKTKTFKAINSVVLKKKKKNTEIIERMTLSHNDCRLETLVGDYDYLLHLESDVFPPKDVIEKLLFHKKKFINGLYYTDEGSYRRPLIQTHLELAPNYGHSYWCTYKDEIKYVNGKTYKLALAGLGCALIHHSLLKRIEFRFEKGIDKHPDTFFAEDCEKLKVPIYIDTSIICEHKNKSWGVYGIDYK
jgi:hypothetical protein